MNADSDTTLNVAMVIPRTEAEGPGVRYALWVQGCPMRCVGCCNPEMLAFRERDRREVDALVREVLDANVEGVSLLGGEPFSQAAALARFARGVKREGKSVMVFTGHTLNELHAMRDPHVDALLAETDLLVDGRYIAEQRTTTRRWVGSSNQVMHHLTDRYAKDDPRFREPNHVEIRMRNGEITVNGWPVHGARTRV